MLCSKSFVSNQSQAILNQVWLVRTIDGCRRDEGEAIVRRLMNPESTAYYPGMVATDPEVREPNPWESPPSSGLLDKGLPSASEVPSRPEAAVQTCQVSDESLLDQVSEGRKDALSILFVRHAPRVLNVAKRILKDDSEAEDLLQELFLFLYEKAHLFDRERSSASSWIIQMTYHRAIDRRRYLGVRQHYALQNVNPEHHSAAYGQVSIDEVAGRALLSKLREELSTEQLQTLELHFFEGYTFHEIAKKTGQSYGNVRHHYYRSLERLRSFVFAGKQSTR